MGFCKGFITGSIVTVIGMALGCVIKEYMDETEESKIAFVTVKEKTEEQASEEKNSNDWK